MRSASAAAVEHAPLTAEIAALSRRARIRLDTPSGPASATPKERSTAEKSASYGLTDRELVVIRLLASGHTNSEIGTKLFISPKTASVHVTNILRKLGVANRIQAGTVAEQAGLLDD